MSNNFDTPIILDASTCYLGFGRATSPSQAAESTDARIYYVTEDPNGIPIGDFKDSPPPVGSCAIEGAVPPRFWMYDGTQWIEKGNAGGLTAHNLDFHSDVTIAGPAGDEVLQYNGAVWTNQVQEAPKVSYTVTETLDWDPDPTEVGAALDDLAGRVSPNLTTPFMPYARAGDGQLVDSELRRASANVFTSQVGAEESLRLSPTAFYVGLNAGGTSGGASGARAFATFGGRANGDDSIALCNDSLADGANSIAVGPAATSDNASSIAIGNSAVASGASNALAIGPSAVCGGERAIAIGTGATANADSAVCIGNLATADASSAIAIGDGASADFANAVAVGAGSSVDAADCAAVGINVDVTTGGMGETPSFLALGIGLAFAGSDQNASGVCVGVNRPGMFITNDVGVGGTLSYAGFGALAGGSALIQSALDVADPANPADQFGIRSAFTPASSADASGATGSIVWDDNYIYVRTSTGWKRSALAAF